MVETEQEQTENDITGRAGSSQQPEIPVSDVFTGVSVLLLLLLLMI